MFGDAANIVINTMEFVDDVLVVCDIVKVQESNDRSIDSGRLRNERADAVGTAGWQIETEPPQR